MGKDKILNKVLNSDARDILKHIPSNIEINTTITSPPYYDMKDYGSDSQIGFGQDYQTYLNDLQAVFKGVYNRTRKDGTLWIIIDTFKRNSQVVTLPFDLANKLQETGWYLQDIIIWKKDKTVPWSANGFMQRKFEYILFFSKSKDFKTNRDNVRIYNTDHLKKWWIKYPERYNPKGKALDEVWEFPIPTQGSWGSKYIRHFCPLPQDMVATMIEISTENNDIILDPFAGTGTVLSQSAFMNRNYIGFELNRQYIKMFKSYLKEHLSEQKEMYAKHLSNNNQSNFQTTILNLRALKYAKLLLNQIDKFLESSSTHIGVTILNESKNKNKHIIVNYSLTESTDNDSLNTFISSLVTKPPFSKFGIEPQFEFQKIIDEYEYHYTKTNTHSHSRANKNTRIHSNIIADFNEKDYM